MKKYIIITEENLKKVVGQHLRADPTHIDVTILTDHIKESADMIINRDGFMSWMADESKELPGQN